MSIPVVEPATDRLCATSCRLALELDTIVLGAQNGRRADSGFARRRRLECNPDTSGWRDFRHQRRFFRLAPTECSVNTFGSSGIEAFQMMARHSLRDFVALAFKPMLEPPG